MLAEGNPDEEKIGAFGVGFYSLFSVTEEPFVKSGSQWMGFYWKDKKDQLFARRGDLPKSTDSDSNRQWTTFEMGLRESAPMPSAFDFIRFLTSSITFMAHLDEVTVWLDGKRLAKLTKDKGIPKDLPIPSGFRNTSDANMMTLKRVKTTCETSVSSWYINSYVSFQLLKFLPRYFAWSTLGGLKRSHHLDLIIQFPRSPRMQASSHLSFLL